jgi:hypothetical protein
MSKQLSRVYLKNPRDIEGVFASQIETKEDIKAKNKDLKSLVAPITCTIAFIALLIIIGIVLLILKLTVETCSETSWRVISLPFVIASSLITVGFFFYYKSLLQYSVLTSSSTMLSFLFRYNKLIVALSAYLAQFLILFGLGLDESFSPSLSRVSTLFLVILVPLPLMSFVILIFRSNMEHMVIEAGKIYDSLYPPKEKTHVLN